MAAFRFRLFKLLGLREKAERDAAFAFAHKESRVRACEAEIEAMRTDRQGLLQRRDVLQRGRVRPASLGENRFQLIVLERAELASCRQLVELRREAETARRMLVERSKEKRLLEKLSERQRAEHEQEERRRERREEDSRPPSRHGTPIAE